MCYQGGPLGSELTCLVYFTLSLNRDSVLWFACCGMHFKMPYMSVLENSVQVVDWPEAGRYRHYVSLLFLMLSEVRPSQGLVRVNVPLLLPALLLHAPLSVPNVTEAKWPCVAWCMYLCDCERGKFSLSGLSPSCCKYARSGHHPRNVWACCIQ